MITIPSKTNYITIGYPVDPHSFFEPGMFAQFYNNGYCSVSDGSFPIGIIKDTRNNFYNTVQLTNLINVIETPNLQFSTDQYEPDVLGSAANAPLYCSPNGKWTSIKNGNIQGRLINITSINKQPTEITVEYNPTKTAPATINNSYATFVPINKSFVTIPMGIGPTTNSSTVNVVPYPGQYVWGNFGWEGVPAVPASTPNHTAIEYGVTCSDCKEYFPHAEKKPGFKCYSCRMIW